MWRLIAMWLLFAGLAAEGTLALRARVPGRSPEAKGTATATEGYNLPPVKGTDGID